MALEELLVDIDAAPTFEHLLDIRISFADVHIFTTPTGMRLTYVVKDGRCAGPRIAADVLAGGGDWVVVGSDRVARLDVRATLRTDDGVLIHLTNTGRVQMDQQAADRLMSGELITHEQMYARSSPLFETDDERYRWLGATHTVALHQLSLTEVQYRVFAVG